MTLAAEKLATRLMELVPEDALRAAVSRHARHRDYTIYQADPVGFCEKELGLKITSDVRSMMESVVKSRVTVAISGNGPGKTHGGASIGVWFKKAFPGSQVITAAPPPAERNLKKKLWGEIRKLVRAHQEMFPSDEWSIGSLDILERADDLSFITGVTIPATGGDEERESRFSGSHSRHLLFIFDEGDAIEDFAFNGADGCMSGGLARMLIMFNPRRKAGAAYRKIKDGKASVVRLNVFNHPNVVTGEAVIPGACDRETTVRRINEWTEPLGAGVREDLPGVFRVPEFLVGSVAADDAGKDYLPLRAGHRRVTDARFSYMVLGEYPPEGSNQLISEVWVDNARVRWDAWRMSHGGAEPESVPPPEGVQPIMGQDVADEGDDLNASVSRYGGWVSMPETWRGVDPAASGVRGGEKYHRLRAKALCVDGNGLGAGTVGAARGVYRWRCSNPECGWDQEGAANAYLHSCPRCGWEPVRKVATFVVKVMTAESPTERVRDLGRDLGEFNKLRDQLAWMVREWLRTDPGAMLPPCKRLTDAMLCIEYREDRGKMRVSSKDDMRKALGYSPDEWDALCLTFAYGTKERKVRWLRS